MPTISIAIPNLKAIQSAFRAAPAEMTKELGVALRTTIFQIKAAAQRNAPVATGRLRASAYTNFQPLRGEVGFTAKYAAFVHDGYGPFTILPVNKKALYWKGAEHPVRRINHPGFAGNPFLARAVDSNEGSTNTNFRQAVERVLATIAQKGNN